MAAEPGATPRKLLTTYSPNHQTLEWSPDGTLLAFLEGDEPKFNAYITDRLAVAEVGTGKVRQLTAALDRAVLSPALRRRRRARSCSRSRTTATSTRPRSSSRAARSRSSPMPMVVHELAAAAGHTAVLVSSDQRRAGGVRARGGQAAAR